MEGFEPEQQKQQQSYFVRLGSLSTKLRHRALQHSLGKLQSARSSSQEVLAQLQGTLDLVGPIPMCATPLLCARSSASTPGSALPAGGAPQAGHGPEAAGGAGEAAAAVAGVEQEAAGQWQGAGATRGRWRMGGVPGGSPSVSIIPSRCRLPPQAMESRALALLQGLTQQLQSSCQPLVSSLQGLPGSLQDTVGQVRHSVEGLRAALGSAASLQDVTGTVLAQARANATRARQLMDELVEHVARNPPLTWLVGPFAPSGQNVVELEMK